MNVLEEIYEKLYAEKKVLLDKTKSPLPGSREFAMKHGGAWYQDEKNAGYITHSGLPKDHCQVIFGDEYKDEAMSFIKKKEKTTLVIPDTHAIPGQDTSRFLSLGKMIVDRKPDNIVFMGDFVTLESLSAWDLGKAGKMEGKRYSEDCKAGTQALSYILGPLRDLQLQQAVDGEKIYKPRLIYIMGNHEDRLDRYLATKPELSAHLDVAKDLALEDSGFTDIIPYRGFIELEGVLFTHAVMNAANLAIGGKTALSTIASAVSKSVVIGHLHRFETVNHYRHGADDIIQIVSSGCFFDGVEDYADGGLNAYWRGVLLLSHYKLGRFDIESISTDRLVDLY